MKKVYLYKGYERFWHWTQSVLIILLLLTGFEIHNMYSLFGYKEAMQIHDISAIAFIVLIIFTIFWDMVTGEWKQYLPKTKNFGKQVEYYLRGIFIGSNHPVQKTLHKKFNPVQGVVYLLLKLVMMPLVMITGILYFLYQNSFFVLKIGSLEVVAVLHTLGAFLFLAFLIVHLYLITTGKTATSNLKAMITGWEEIDEEELKEIEKELEEDKRRLVNVKS